jgi:cyanophycinase
MNGLINLVGSGEYLPVMKDVDCYLLDSLGLNGRKARVACMPTAAGREGDSSVNRWLTMGVQHFTSLGAEVSPVRIIDRDSANDPQWEPILENADLIYFSGGDPGYLYETMKDSRAWNAAQRAWDRGARRKALALCLPRTLFRISMPSPGSGSRLSMVCSASSRKVSA